MFTVGSMQYAGVMLCLCCQSSQQPLSVCYHGSRLVQALAGFKDRSVLMNSLHELSSADLLTLGTDPMGSRALQALVTSASDKGRGKILRKMQVKRHKHVWFCSEETRLMKSLSQDMYVELACSACGSRLLEAVWSSATVSQRQSIAERLGEQTCVNTTRAYIRLHWVQETEEFTVKIRQAARGQNYSLEKDKHRQDKISVYIITLL